MERQITFIVPDSLAVSESGFLFLASTGETFTVNAIGREVFMMMKEGKPLDAVKARLLDEYDVDRKTLDRDVDDFISQLKHFKLIKVQ